MSLTTLVRVNDRFQRAIRIDTDGADVGALAGYFCPQSSAEILRAMAKHVSDSPQGAFTWTGPYGSGKSSLALAFSALLCGQKAAQEAAAKSLGKRTAETVRKSFCQRTARWTLIPVIGRRESCAAVFGAALQEAGLAPKGRRSPWSDREVVDALQAHLQQRPTQSILVLVDEMGKFLEGAAHDGLDVYLFQLLAELASRSKHRFVIVGILHQAFEEYANKLSRTARDEWTKIQGRFVDFSVNASGEEQVELLARAIDSTSRPKTAATLAKGVANTIRAHRTGVSASLETALGQCWPLHPSVACLLGPISRRRFGQNQRSVFGFLNSSEAGGFQDFLKSATTESIYTLHLLWDYLQLNLEPAILASPDGHRWATAAEAVHRCESRSSEKLATEVLKSIAVIDLFRDRSGLVANRELLGLCFADVSGAHLKRILDDLVKASLVVFRQHLDSYVTFAGSDFDFEAALKDEREQLERAGGSLALERLARMQPIVAKRHYDQTGAMRWFDVQLVELKNLVEFVADGSRPTASIGAFVLAIAAHGESEEEAERIVVEARRRRAENRDVIIGLSPRSWLIPKLVVELAAIQKVKANHPELAGDAVARREVSARESSAQAQLDQEMRSILQGAEWHRKGHSPERLNPYGLSRLASDLANKRFKLAPRLLNELANRAQPSSSAVAAINQLLRAMVLHESTPRLGLEGYSAEAGLYESLLAATGLHAETHRGWAFVAPSSTENDTHHLLPLWSFTEAFLKAQGQRLVSAEEIFGHWRSEPYGVKDGLMPMLLTAFVLSHIGTVAAYREGQFQARLRDIDVEYLARDANDFQIRWMDLSRESRELMNGLAEIVAHHTGTAPRADEPFDVARGLVSIYEGLPAWARRTARISPTAFRVRELLKQANDPNKLLFEDIPRVLASTRSGDLQQITIEAMREGLDELTTVFPKLLQRLWSRMLAELHVQTGRDSISELKDRAENIRLVAGDFRLDAFVNRLAVSGDGPPDVEGLCTLAVNKPSRDWTDADVERMDMELSSMCSRFANAEAFAHIKGRSNKRNSVAIVLSRNGERRPLLQEFTVTEREDEEAIRLALALEQQIKRGGASSWEVALAALSRVTAQYIEAGAAESGRKSIDQTELAL